jgi:hypothetical protein
MAVLPLLRESVADPRLASGSPEQQCSDSAFGPGDMFFSSRQGGSGLLPAVWAIRLRSL